MRSCRSSSLDGVNGFFIKRRRREEQEEGRKTAAEKEEEGAAAGSHCAVPSVMGGCCRKDHHMPTSWCGPSQFLERWQKHLLFKLSSLWCCYIAAENEMTAVGSSQCTVDLDCCQKDSLLVPVSSSPRVPWALLVWLSLEKMPQVMSHVHKLYPQVPRLFDLFHISSNPLAKGMVTIKCRLNVQSLCWWGEDGILGGISVNCICHKPWANDLKKEGGRLDSPRFWFKAFLGSCTPIFLLSQRFPIFLFILIFGAFWDQVLRDSIRCGSHNAAQADI